MAINYDDYLDPPSEKAASDPFAAMGGGFYDPKTGGWIMKSMKPASPTPATPGPTPEVSQPMQAPKDVAVGGYLAQAQQGTQINKADPNLRQQADPYAAAVERARRQYESETAERMSAQGLGNSGAMQAERRLASERAGQAVGSFESQLVARELQNRRAEIQAALAALMQQGQFDQAQALQRELAQLDAQLKQAGIDAQRDLGGRELALKDKLGMGGLNLDAMRMLLQNQQFGDQLGFNIADREAFWNNAALQSLF